MSSIRRFLDALDPLVGKDAVAPLRWKYEQDRIQGKILLPPPPDPNAFGEYCLGNVTWRDQRVSLFGLHEHELPQHIAVFGRSGSGKSNCSYLILQQLLNKAKPFLVFDWKQTYRTFCRAYPVGLYTPGHSTAPFYFNPLDLTGISPELREAYLRHLLSVILNVYFKDLKLLSVEGVEYLLLKGFNHLSQANPVFTFQDLYYWIANYKPISRERDWKSSALNALYKLSSGPLGDVLNCQHSHHMASLVHEQSVIELHSLGSPKDKSMLVQSLLLQLYYHFGQYTPTERLRFMILIEESHNVLLKHDEGYETVVEMILRQIREWGVSICLNDQHPSLMSLPALGAYTKICFNQCTHPDINTMGAALALEEDRGYLGQLPTGDAIVKLQGRYLQPFLVRFPLWSFPRYPQAKLAHRVTTKEGQTTDVQTADRISQRIRPQQQISSESKGFPGRINGEENPKIRMKSLLVDIHEHPLSSTVDRYRRLYLGTKRGNRIKEQLLSQRFIQPVKVHLNRTRVQLFEITELGKQYLREHGINPDRPGRHGGLQHQYWASNIKKCLEQHNYQVEEEFPVGGGKAIDLVATKANRRIAIEIETGKSDADGNVNKCMAAGFQRIVVVAASARVKDKLCQQGLINDNRVEIYTASEFLTRFAGTGP